MATKSFIFITVTAISALVFLAGCSTGISKKDDPIEQTKDYVVGLRADEIQAQIIAARTELAQLKQMMSAFGPVSDSGEDYTEKASSAAAKIRSLEEELKRVEDIKNK